MENAYFSIIETDRKMLYRTFLILLISLSAAVQAVSIASSLPGYAAALKVTSISGLSAAPQISGVAYHPGSKMLYVVDNGNDMIYELDTAGKVLRSISTSGFNDIEGISYQADRYFYIAEEGTSSVVRISIPAAGTGPVAKSSGRSLVIGTGWGNNGLEGVSYCPSNKTVYGVKERLPPQIHRVTLDSAGNPVAAFANDPFNIEAKSGDAADIASLSDGTFLIVDQEENKLVGYNAQGKVLSELSLQAMTQPEGVAVDEANGTIYVAGEPRQLFVFRQTTATSTAGKSTTALAAARVRFEKKGTIRFFLSTPCAMHLVMDFLTIQGKRLLTTERTLASGDDSFAVVLNTHGAGMVICRLKAGNIEQKINVFLGQ
jgi:uncharacterized protein YjiK